jgi:phosphatidylglycerol lysyltransferase
MLGVAVFVLQRELDHLSVAEVLQGLSKVPVREVLIAIGLAVVSFLIGGFYEAVTLDAVRHPLGIVRPLVVYTIANSIGHCLGWSLVTGGALRWRLYERDGLSGRAIAAMAALSAVPFFLGSWLLLALASIAAASTLGPQINVSSGVLRGFGGAALLSFVSVAVLLSRRGCLNIGRFRLSTPGKKLLAVQIAAGVVELAIVASMLYVLMDVHATVSYSQFLVSYVAAVLLGQISSVPAGLGVLEASLLMLLPQVPPATLIAAVASYRALYEVLPLAVGVMMLAIVELRWRYRASRMSNDGRAAKSAVAPRA